MKDVLDKKALAKLWSEYWRTNAKGLRDHLITNYLHLVKYSAGRIGGTLPSHIRLEDLYSSGVMGLIKAVENYDPQKKAKFESYAILRIKGAIIDELRALDWVPRSVHQLANKISEAQKHLRAKLKREPFDSELAQHLGITIKQLEERLIRIRPAIMISLDEKSGDGDDTLSTAERIPDIKSLSSDQKAEKKELAQILRKAIEDLPQQERQVMVLYYYDKLMVKEIAEVMELTSARISQIHSKALLRLRDRLRSFSTNYALH
ncbi:MAG: FliA/WhiG family RNA polymerase sigma factor [Chlamydiota bacterium]